MSDHFATLGPCAVDLTPLKDFSKIPLNRAQMEDVWRLCGPSANHNMQRFPLWQVIAAAYVEGASHAVSILKDKPTPGAASDE